MTTTQNSESNLTGSQKDSDSANGMSDLNSIKIIKLVITHVIPLVILLLPTSTVLTLDAKLFIAVTVWMLLWAAFELSDLFLPAIIYPALLVFLNVLPAKVAYSPWATLVMPMLFGAFLLSNVLEEIGLLKRIAYFIIRKTGGTYNGTVWGIFFSCMLLALITFGGSIIIGAALCFGVCKTLNLQGKKEGAIVMMAGMLGSSTVLGDFYTPPFVGAMTVSARTVQPDFNIDVYHLFFHNFPVLIFCAIFVWLMLFFGKTKSSDIGGGKEFFNNEYKKLGPISLKEKKASILLIIIMAFILLSPIHKKSAMYAFIFIPAIMLFPGMNICSKEAFSKINIGMCIFVASCMAIGAGCVGVNLTEVIGSKLTPIFNATGRVEFFLFAILLFGILLNLTMTPMGMLSGFTGVLIDIGSRLGINSMAVAYTFLLAADIVFLPYEYISFLIFFSFGIMSTSQFIKYHSLKSICFLAFYLLIILPFWKLIQFI